jgi:hypothetical protein
MYLSGTMGHLATVLRRQFRIIHLPTDYSPTTPTPNHTGILDGSLTGSILVEAHWIDGAAVAFVAHEAGCVVTTLTGAALPPSPGMSRLLPSRGGDWYFSRGASTPD